MLVSSDSFLKRIRGVLTEHIAVLREGLRASEIKFILWSKGSTWGDVVNERADVGFVTYVSLVGSSTCEVRSLSYKHFMTPQLHRQSTFWDSR